MNRLNSATALPQAVTAAYDAANELTTYNNPTPNLTYDSNGNLTSDGVKNYTWNSRNQLVGISGGGVTASFVYDAVGRRISKTINGARTDYQFDRNDIVSEIGGGAVGATYVRSLNIDEPFARITSAGVEYYHTDALGSVFALIDASGNTTATYIYDPFGNTTQTGISTNPFQYAGREADTGTGLLFYRARYYSPALQRFISEDPIGLSSRTINFYSYVFNSPLTFIDPKGLDVFSFGVQASAFIGVNRTKPDVGIGKEVTIGIAFDTSSMKLELFKSVGVADPNNPDDRVTGGNFGLGFTFGQLKGCLKDFHGSSTENTTVIGPIGYSDVTTSDGKKGFSYSFGGKGIGFSNTIITTYTSPLFPLFP